VPDNKDVLQKIKLFTSGCLDRLSMDHRGQDVSVGAWSRIKSILSMSNTPWGAIKGCGIRKFHLPEELRGREHTVWGKLDEEARHNVPKDGDDKEGGEKKRL